MNRTIPFIVKWICSVFLLISSLQDILNPTGSVKDRAALNMIEKAEAEGKLKPEGTIVESTSGNIGISLAAFAAAKGYHLHIFMEPGCTPERVQILKAYGVTVQYYQDIPGFNEIIANYGFGTAGMVVALLQIYCLEKNKNGIVGLIDDPYYK